MHPMTDTETALLTAARITIDELGRWADEHQCAPLCRSGRKSAFKAWRLAKETLAHAVRWCEADDPETCTAEVYAEVTDLAEAIGACEHALRLGSAAPAPVAVVVEAALAMANLTAIELDLLTQTHDHPTSFMAERYWMECMSGDRDVTAARLVAAGLAVWAGEGLDTRLVVNDRGAAVVEAARPKPGTRIYPAWEPSYAHEDFDRRQALCSQLTDEDRAAGLTGTFKANVERARQIVAASRRSSRC